MNIEVKANESSSNQNLHHFVKHRADLALSALGDQIDLVSVVVDGADAAGGESDRRCLVMVRSSMHPDVIVENPHANPYVAIHQAVDDASWTVAGNFLSQQQSLIHRQCEVIKSQRANPDLADHFEPDRAA